MDPKQARIDGLGELNPMAKTGKAEKRKLSAREDIFVREYAAHFNGVKAAIAAGYSEKTARQQASRLLTKVNIQERLRILLAERASALDVTAERILREITLIAYSNIQPLIEATDAEGYIDLKKITRAQAAAIQEATVDQFLEGSGEFAHIVRRIRIKLGPKLDALKLLGQYKQLWTDKYVRIDASKKPISEMTDEELDVIIRQAEGELTL
jgi:phage terminase small subunit